MNIFITIDYELFFGKKSGSIENSIIKPVEKFLNILKTYNLSAVIFVDAGYLLNLRVYKKKYPVLEKEYQLLINNLEKLNKNNCDIQLHIHSHWEDSYFNGETWIFETDRYSLTKFTEANVLEIVSRYKNVLKEITNERIFCYRAGGWCLQPFSKLKNALKQNDIWLDSSVYDNGYDKSLTHFYDYRKSPGKTEWRFEDDPLFEETNGFFLEIPISSIKVSPFFYWQLAYYKKARNIKMQAYGDGVPIYGSKKSILKKLLFPCTSVVSIDGYKVSFLNKAFNQYKKNVLNKNFVIIGHPKAFSPYSLEKLENFIKENITNNNFTTFYKEYKDFNK